ncbi:hypothetical protein FJZ27_00700 [Candidatus Peribacteria bacterium]|nr:hypothetical protein [Candidatus Peribacteria bacterium]
MDIWLLMGIVGMALILMAFFLLETHRWSADGIAYDVCNLAGAVLLVINAFHGKAWPFLILNAVWGLVSLRDVILDCRGTHRSTIRKG